MDEIKALKYSASNYSIGYALVYHLLSHKKKVAKRTINFKKFGLILMDAQCAYLCDILL